MPNASNAIEWLKQEVAPVRCLTAAVAAGRSVAQALNEAQVPEFVRRFVGTTFSIIDSGQPHAVAAFPFGHEDLIPAMFRRLVGDLCELFPGQLDTFTYYLDRHIQLDEEVHAPLAQQMVRELCGIDATRWQDCRQVTVRSLEVRIALWDGIKPALTQRALA